MVLHAGTVSDQIHFEQLETMPYPRAVLMCPPEWFDIVDVKNPFMQGQQGHVDTALARREWQAVKDAFEDIGIEVRTDAPLPGCEDMVFCANPVFTGLDSSGQRVCVLSHMRFDSRKKEVGVHAEWFRSNGYRVVPIETPGLFEGSGDALWHPWRRLIWGGYGFRTSKEVYEEISNIFHAPVIPLELVDERFYHLDTCFCPLDEHSVMVFPGAFSGEGFDAIRRVFRRIIEVDESEAGKMACNATPFLGRYIVIQRGLENVNRSLRATGFQVVEVETSEFLKSGGSVFCMKSFLF